MDTPLNISTTSGGSALMPMMSAPMVTLPTIPNPTPPPPQKLTVVTPALAQKDLATKQSTTSQISAAMQQQTASKILNSFGQPISQAPGTPVPQAGAEQQQVAPPGTQPQQQQTTATKPGATTPTDPNVSQVTLPNGMKANYNAASQTLVTEDGKPLTWSTQQNAWVDPTTQLPPQQGTANAQTGVPSTGDPTSDYILSQMQQNQAQSDANTASWQSSMQKILNGTFPLTADQQAQVTGLQGQFDRLKTLQEDANKNFVNATKLLGIRGGRQQYQPGEYAAQVNKAVSTGIQKIADLDMQAASAVGALKQGFMDNDYKIINESYKALQDANNAKNATLKDMQSVVKSAVDIESAKIQQQSDKLDIQNKVVNAVAKSALSAALKLDGTLDLDAIQRIADEQGIDPNTLYGAVVKEQQDEIKFQQSESKFASDQLQAAAQLEGTKANTSKTYQDIAKTKQEMAASAPIDLSKLPANQAALVPAFNSALTGVPGTSQAQAKSTFNQLVNSGDTQGAKDYIVRVAASTLPTAIQTQVIGRSEAINALTDIQSLLDQAKAKDNGTGIVKGSLINVASKLGQSADPDLQYIGNRIQQQLQTYRHAMTGAAFTEAEMKQYKNIFPDITDANNLNTTKISALRDGMDSNNRSDLEFAIGKKNYNAVFDKAAVELPSDKTSTTGPAVDTDGAAYGFPGYHSDGTQWVPNK